MGFFRFVAALAVVGAGCAQREFRMRRRGNISLHGFATVADPGSLRLLDGVWDPKSHTYRNFPDLVDLKQADNGDKVTFVFRYKPYTDLGGNHRQKGKLYLTLYRKQAPDSLPAYLLALFPTQDPVPGTFHHFRSKGRVAVYLESDRAASAGLIDQLMESLVVNEPRLNGHFAIAADRSSRLRKVAEMNLKKSQQAVGDRAAVTWLEHDAETASRHEARRFGLARLLLDLDANEGRWIATQFFEDGKAERLRFLIWDPKREAWGAAFGDRHGLSGLVDLGSIHFAGLALDGLDPQRVYIYLQHLILLEHTSWDHDDTFAEYEALERQRITYYQRSYTGESMPLFHLPDPPPPPPPVVPPAKPVALVAVDDPGVVREVLPYRGRWALVRTGRWIEIRMGPGGCERQDVFFGNCQFVDRQDNILGGNAIFDRASEFEDGRAKVTQGDREGYIDESGAWL
jgi:hypothetical protein